MSGEVPEDAFERAAYDLLLKWKYGVNGADKGKVKELASVIRDVHKDLMMKELSKATTAMLRALDREKEFKRIIDGYEKAASNKDTP